MSMHAASHTAFNRRDLVLVVAVHGAAVWGLLQMNVISLPAPLATLSVSLIQPAETIQPKRDINPPIPRPMMRLPTPMPQPVLVAAPADVPAAATLVPPPVPPPQAAVAAVPALVPAAPSQPRFDADYLDNPKPAYPALSRRIGEQGRVVLRVRVAADGQAADVQVQTSSGSPRLDQSALDTVRRWKFVPARLGNDAVAATVLVPIAFSLKD